MPQRSEAERSASQDFVHTADLSAFAGYSAIPVNLLNLIIGPRAPSHIQLKNLKTHYRLVTSACYVPGSRLHGDCALLQMFATAWVKELIA